LVGVLSAGALVEGGDVTVGSKELFNIFIGHIGRKVLNVNIVEKLSLVTTVLRLELYADKVFTFLGIFESFGG
jgi:hypothetical protein